MEIELMKHTKQELQLAEKLKSKDYDIEKRIKEIKAKHKGE